MSWLNTFFDMASSFSAVSKNPRSAIFGLFLFGSSLISCKLGQTLTMTLNGITVFNVCKVISSLLANF